MTDEGSDNNKKVVVNIGQRLCSDGKRLENGVRRVEERALLDTGGSRVNEVGGGGRDIKDGLNGMAHSAGSGLVPPPSQQPSQGTAVCWERFLHLRSLRVLLVENDDCTRHVVAALLRNCSYEVVEASNGIQAWRILEDITNHIDLVLTEVALPCFMGISLLCKIMSHKSRNNVPVIMMSSHDSMGLVFKCLSKGAADFLVKPIRKNELKNLWQHVWRRCHSSSGSGSESGTHTQKSVKSKSVNKSDNDSGSNNEQESESPPLNFGDDSDHGSGTQSSWTNQVVEDMESPRPATLLDDIAECPDSTCAQFIHASALPPANLASMAATKEGQEVKETPAGTGKALEVSAVINSGLQPKFPAVVRPVLTTLNPSGMRKIEGSHTVNDQIYKGVVESNAENAYGEPNDRTLKVTGNMPGYSYSPSESKGFDAANKISKISDINDSSINESQEQPSVGQSLKKLRGLQDAGKTKQEERNVLRCSESSAFSRYNAVPQNKIAGVDARSPSPLEKLLDGRSEMLNIQSCCGSNAPNQFSVGGGVHVDVTSFSNDEYADKVVANNKSVETPTIHNLHPGSVIQPRKRDALRSPQQATLDDRSAVTPAKMFVQPAITNQELKIQHLHSFDSHQLPVCKVQPLAPNHDNLPPKNMEASTVHYSSCNIVGGHVEGNAANYSMNGSGSGSNHGSNQGSSTAAVAGGMNRESNNGMGGKGGDASGSGSGGGSGSGDKSRLAQREAALTKFRQKRKERCFNRKGRKNLAEQRPRVRGQFVRQLPQESGSNTSRDTSS